MTDVLVQLPRLSWRGIEVPCTHSSARFAQDEVVHRYTYRDKELIESTGLQNWTFNHTIPFRENIAKGPYKNLFLVTFQQFVAACRDRTTGDYVDPVLGPMRAKCTDWSHEVDVNKRDGVDVTVSFKYAPDDDQDGELWNALDSLQNATSEAGELDSEVMGKDWAQEAGLQPMIDPFLLAQSMAKMAEFKMGQVAAALEDATSKIDKTIDAINELQDPTQWPVRQSAIRLKDAAQRLALQVMSPGRALSQLTVGSPITISALASQLGMDMQAFLALNPMLAMTPMVPAGITVYYYA